MDLQFLLFLTPPIFSKEGVYIIAFEIWQLEKTHWVLGDCLCHYFNKYLMPRYWNEFFLPPHYSLGNLFLQVFEGVNLWLATSHRHSRYLSQFTITLAPSNCCIAFLIFGLVFLLKQSEVFCLLMAWPEATSYCPKRCNNLWHSPIVARQDKRLSSANSRWETLTPCWLDLIPFITLVSSAFLKRVDKPSAQNKKRYEHRRTPCLISHAWRIDETLWLLIDKHRVGSYCNCLHSQLNTSWIKA